jgi:hypothetical protein
MSVLDQMFAKTGTQIALVNLAGSEAGAWETALRETSEHWSPVTMPSLADIQVALEEDHTHYAVIVYRESVQQIVAGLENGQPATEALVDWESFAEKLIALHERFGERMTVMTEPKTHEDLVLLTAHLQNSTSYSIESPDEVSFVGQAFAGKTVETDFGLTLVSMQLLALRRPKELLERLEAMTFPMGLQPYVPDLVTRFLDTRSDLLKAGAETSGLRSKAKDQEKRLSRVEKDNSMLIEQLHKTQEELEGRIVKERGLYAKLNDLRRGREYRKNKISDLEKALVARDEKMEWLRSVGRKHREAARILRSEKLLFQNQIRDLEKKLTSAEAKINGLRNSRSWKYTRVFRKVNGIQK